MRNRYRSAMYGLAATVALTTAVSLSAAGAASAATHKAKPNVTPACAFQSYCSDPVYNIEFGTQYFVNDNNALLNPGNAINLAWANDNNPGQDWTVDLQGSVHQLYKLGFVSAAIELHYKKSYAAEVMYTPYGVQSNLCRGLWRNAYQGEVVTLQWCGTFPRTLWIIGSNENASPHTTAKVGDKPNLVKSTSYYGGNELISASGTNPSIPYVLTAGGGVFGGNPFATLQVDRPTADDGYVNPGQLWCTVYVDYSATGPPTYNDEYPNCFDSGISLNS
jgi:hypothetical protein